MSGVLEEKEKLMKKEEIGLLFDAKETRCRLMGVLICQYQYACFILPCFKTPATSQPPSSKPQSQPEERFFIPEAGWIG